MSLSGHIKRTAGVTRRAAVALAAAAILGLGAVAEAQAAVLAGPISPTPHHW